MLKYSALHRLSPSHSYALIFALTLLMIGCKSDSSTSRSVQLGESQTSSTELVPASPPRVEGDDDAPVPPSSDLPGTPPAVDLGPVEPDVEAAPVSLDPLDDPDSRENLSLLRSYRRDRIDHLCVPYLRSTTDQGLRFHTFTATHWIGNFLASNRLYLADNLGNKLPGGPYDMSITSREVFGAENLLIECDHEIHGIQRLFMPAIGAVGDGLASDVLRPEWLIYGAENNNTRNQRATLFVSLESDLVFKLYRALATEESETVGTVSDERRNALLIDAKAQVATLGVSSTQAVDGDYVLYSSVRAAGNEDKDEAVLAYAGVMEKFRFLAERTRGIDSDVNAISDELVSQLLGAEREPNFGDLVAISFLGNAYERLNTNSGFEQRLEGWTEYDNTQSTVTGVSDGYTFLGTTRNTVGLELTSNVVRGGESQQRGIYQEIDVVDQDLSSVFVVADYSKLLGQLESCPFVGFCDAAGVASISMEYLDSGLTTLGVTHFANTEDPLFADTLFYNAPVSLQSSVGSSVIRVPNVPNSGLTANVGDEARTVVGARYDDIRYVRVYAVVGDYIGGDFLRHFLLGVVLAVPECTDCKAELEVHSLELRSLK